MDIADKYLTWNTFIEWVDTRKYCKALSFTSFDSQRITLFIRNPEIIRDSSNNYVKFVCPQSEFFLYKVGVLSISRIREGWELILENMEKVIIFPGGIY